MIHGDNILNNQQDIVDAFADHFSSVFNRDRIHDDCNNSCSINNTPCDFCDRKWCISQRNSEFCDNHLVFNSFTINDCDIIKAVKKIRVNNVCGPDNIPAFLLLILFVVC
jgi:hypothetical protein